MSREAQVADTALFRKDLPKSGCYSALDIGVRLTNDDTVVEDKDFLDVIKHISLVCNGNDYRVHISGKDLFKHYWMKHGRPMPYNWTEVASTGVNEVWFRLEFGRYLGDDQFGLDLSRFNNVQVQIDYDCTKMGTAGTHFTTGTFAVTLIAHQFPYARRPSFRGMMGVREFYTGTTAASGDLVQDLPTANLITALAVSCVEDGVADGTDITDIRIGKNNFSEIWLDGKWYNFAAMQNAALDVREEDFTLVASNGDDKSTHLTNIKNIIVLSPDMTVNATGVYANHFIAGTAVGNYVTLAGDTLTVTVT